MKEYLSKKLKIRESNLKYDFLPSMIEIIERPANKLGTVILFLIIAMIISAVLWASFFKIDVAVTATGSLSPEGGVITLSSSASGTVTEILVSDGEYVTKGSEILKLDATEAELNLSECQETLNVMEVQQEVYKAVYDSISSGDNKDNALEKINTNSYGDYKSVADAIILENSVFYQKLKMYNDAEEKEYAEKEYELSILKNLSNLSASIESASINLKNAENTISKYVINASANGKITGISSFYEGKLIAMGDTTGYIIPEEKENIFIAYVADEDIGEINVGDNVSVKIAALKGTNDEYLSGNIKAISDVAFNNENMGSVYTVEISLPSVSDDIKAGMEGSCDIIIGQRSVLDYFLEPFKNGLDNSLKER